MYELDVDRVFTTTEAKERIEEILYRAFFADERILLTRNGDLLVAVIPAGDLAEYEAFESYYWSHELEKTCLEDEGQPGIPIEVVWAELERELYNSPEGTSLQ